MSSNRFYPFILNILRIPVRRRLVNLVGYVCILV